MKAIQIIAQDLFDKVRSRFSNLEMGDETGAVTIDPAEARFFDFDFVSEGNDLGRVSISLNDLGSLKIYYSQGITENQDDPAKKIWYNFLREMRMFAMRRLLRFDTRDIAKTNLDKNDFQHLAATQGPKEEPEMTQTMNESRWSQKSTKKTSRAVKGNTEVIVRHSNPVDEEYAGSRSQRKNIKAIFIQNEDGERFKYPFIHPAGAFAMAQHVDHGGIPHDPAGKAIIQMSEQIAQLQEFQRKIQRTSLHDDAMGITERAVGRLQELKARVEALSKRHHYESWIAEFNEQEMGGNELQELDAVTMEEYKSKFTETNFKEELASFFPLLHSIMREANKVDLESYVSEEDTTDEVEDSDEVKESAFNQFEEWADATEQGKLTPDQIEALKQAFAALPQGQAGPELDFITATDLFNNPEFGLTDLPGFDELENSLQGEQTREKDIQATPIQLFQAWATKNYPELLTALGMSGTQAPAPEAPPTEENTDMEMNPGTMEEGKGSMIKEVAKIVKSFYNEANPNVGPFRGEEGIVIDVEKQISEKFGESAGQQAGKVARAFMEKLTQEWTQKHGGKNLMGETDPLDRLKELLGNVKAKVEGISGQDKSMPAEENTDVDADLVPGKFYVMSSPSGQEGESPDNPPGGFNSAEEADQAKDEIFRGHPDEMISGIPVMQWNGKQFVPALDEEESSHQTKTTMKYADNPTYQQRAAAQDIKSYKDRHDMLTDLERTGKLRDTPKKESTEIESILKLAGLAK